MTSQLFIVLALSGNRLPVVEESFAFFVIAGNDLAKASVNPNYMTSLLNLVIWKRLGCADMHKPVLARSKDFGSAKSPFVIQIFFKAWHGNFAFNPPVKGIDRHDLAILLEGIIPISYFIQLRTLEKYRLPKPVKITLEFLL